MSVAQPTPNSGSNDAHSFMIRVLTYGVRSRLYLLDGEQGVRRCIATADVVHCGEDKAML